MTDTVCVCDGTKTHNLRQQQQHHTADRVALLKNTSPCRQVVFFLHRCGWGLEKYLVQFEKVLARLRPSKMASWPSAFVFKKFSNLFVLLFVAEL